MIAVRLEVKIREIREGRAVLEELIGEVAVPAVVAGFAVRR